MVQVTQGRCGVSILGDTQKPSGHGPRKLSVGEQGLGPDGLRRWGNEFAQREKFFQVMSGI